MSKKQVRENFKKYIKKTSCNFGRNLRPNCTLLCLKRKKNRNSKSN